MIEPIALSIFALAALIGAYQLLTAPTLADRVVALDVVLISLMGGVVVDAAMNRDTTNLVFLVVLAIIGFTTTVSISRFIEHHRGEGSTTGFQRADS
jgi:multicomponent Na+:H+ antiporter subunit F